MDNPVNNDFFDDLKDGLMDLYFTFNAGRTFYSSRQINKIKSEIDYIEFLFKKYIEGCRGQLSTGFKFKC
jgi:hypothetical protein